ncbi:MAG: hypothetical protein ABEJ22_05690 [Haloferacaceae archaeon]
MDRRTLLSTAAGLLSLTAGCVASDGGGPADSPASPSTDSPTSTTPDTTTAPDDSTPTLVDHSFATREACPEPGGATVSFGTSDATVTGCVRGPDGCSVAVLGDVGYDAADDLLTVVVTTERQADEDTACTQAVVDLGYEVTAQFENGLPGTVLVVHEGAFGRVEAARVDPA